MFVEGLYFVISRVFSNFGGRFSFVNLPILLIGITDFFVEYQTAKTNSNRSKIDMLFSSGNRATEADNAIVRMETKIEYIIKGIDEIKAEVKGGKER